MRCTQFVGLSEEASAFLDENASVVGANPCPHCGEPTVQVKETIKDGRYTYGMFEEELSLSTYRLKDGRIAKEIVQASPWSSGPVIFTCLEVDGERVGEWSDEDIDNA